MIGRRRFLEAAALGLISTGFDPSNLFAQDPGAKSKSRSKKAKAASKASPAAGDEAPIEVDQQVNRILGEARTDGRRLPGMIGAIVKGETLTNIGAVGIRKVGSAEPIRVDDAVHLGSCTKAMTATMIGTLVEEGKLGWGSTVAEVFPAWASKVHPDYAAVTLHQLLAHRSGLPRDVRWWQMGEGRSVTEQRRALLSKAMQGPPESRPGSKYSYSNAGFVLAGMMAEEVTRTSWEELMGRRLFGPLGMDSAGFGPPGTPGQLDHAWGHRASGGVVEAVHDDNAPSLGPAGTVHCSMKDWGKFASLHLTGSVGGTRLLKPETLKALHTPEPGEEYVGGWLVNGRPSSDRMVLTHNGSNTYWFCSILLQPSQELALLVATNAAGPPAEQANSQAIRGLMRYVFPEDAYRR